MNRCQFSQNTYNDAAHLRADASSTNPGSAPRNVSHKRKDICASSRLTHDVQYGCDGKIARLDTYISDIPMVTKYLAGESLRRLLSARYHGVLAGPINESKRSRVAPAFPSQISRLVTELVTISERSAQIQFILNNLYLPHRLTTDPTSCHQSGREE
jgi:hypothetical protein